MAKFKTKTGLFFALFYYYCILKAKNNMATQAINTVFFSGIPDFGQTKYRHNLALYDTLDGQGNNEETWKEFVKFPVRAQMVAILFCLEGNIRMRINLQNYELFSGDLAVILPTSVFESLQVFSGSRVTLMVVADTAYHFFPQKRILPAESLPAMNPLVLHFEKPLTDHFTSVYNQLRSLLNDSDFGQKEEAIKGYLQVVSSIIVNQYEHQKTLLTKQGSRDYVKTSRAENIYTRFLSDVHRHFREHRDTAFYADLQCITPKYFGQMIRRSCGRKPSDIIGACVILEAKLLLRSEHHTVQSVCNTLNFPNPSFFCKYFKTHVGQTPRQFADQK